MARHAVVPHVRGRHSVVGVRTAPRRLLPLLLSVILLAASAMSLMLLPRGVSAYADERRMPSTASGLTVSGSWDASRGQTTRVMAWGSSDDSIDVSRVSRARSPYPQVADLMDGRDHDSLPSGFDPAHATGDEGNGYAYGQCTWWAYTRRHELGLPVGSRFGDGRQWADSARALGYWVDASPREGDIVVFRPGQAGADPVYGHVAVVEHVDASGGIRISEANISGRVGPFQRDLDARQAGELEYIHY
ncbi:CHAP domain-containing protein [Bifidobacterium sp. UTBIF-68]|uniref:CHAP domain-containing protein n=1 Tax=Bifidobacterium sp. UTBIF-68 TaxID=1465262 RepID=UPI002158ECEC|nr:CHAP domain-containing protein [Bifidobacterium sp. UTBIF-68]